MEIIACHCNWDIPGIDSLPAHNHVYDQGYEQGPNVHPNGPFKGQAIMRAIANPDVINIWVDWREVSRGLS